MDKEVNVRLGALALQAMHFRIPRRRRMALAREISSGLSIVIESEHDRFQRVVAVVAMEVVNDHGETLLELFRAEDALARGHPSKIRDEAGQMKIECRLPGVRRYSAESFHSASERLLDRLGPLASKIQINGTSHSTLASKAAAPGIKPTGSLHLSFKSPKPASGRGWLSTNYVKTCIHGHFANANLQNCHPNWRCGSLHADETPDGRGFDYLLFQQEGASRCYAWLSAEQQSFWTSHEAQDALSSIARELLNTTPAIAVERPLAQGPWDVTWVRV
jgi:hypothetical protein